MPTMQQFSNARVLLLFGDHAPPHVHIKLRDGRDCTVNLQSFEIKGETSEREIKEALTWIKENQLFLLNEWRKTNI
jgi:hypothetical protein